MIRSSHSQLYKKSSCSVKLQDGPFGHNLRRIPVQDFTFNIFITALKTNSNFAKTINDFGYILTNSCFIEQLSVPASEYTDKCNKRYFSVCQKWKHKNWTRKEPKERKFEKKTKRKWVSSSNIYVAVFAFLF